MVLHLAHDLGLRIFHMHYGQVTGTGLPDLLIPGRSAGQLAFWELKSCGGTLAADQDGWRRDLIRAGATYAVITPADWLCGRVQQWLYHYAALDAAA